MLAILNYLNAHNLPIFQPILMILGSKFMVHRALSDKTYLLLELLSPVVCEIVISKQVPSQHTVSGRYRPASGGFGGVTKDWYHTSK